jgi:hypothetical protein
VHLLPDRGARAIPRFFVKRMPDYGGYPCELAPARAAIAAAGITRCWSLPYAHKPGMAHDLNCWMAETVTDDAMVDRLLFGSDAPSTVVTIEQAVAHVRALGLDGGAESAVLGGTAARLLAA